MLTSGPAGLLDASGTAKSSSWHQDSAGVPGAAEVNDEFGTGGVWTLTNGAGAAPRR